MYTKYRILSFIFCCFLLQMAQPARAQLNGKIFYPEFYTYRAGEDTAWAQPDFDDSGWERIKNGTFPWDRWEGVGWLRFVVEVDSTLWNVPLALSIDAAGAVEFYLDGELVQRIGKVGTTKEEEEPHFGYHTPQIISFHSSSDTVGGKSRHIVAIRYSSFFQLSPVWSGGRWSGRWSIRSIDDVIRMSAQRDHFRRKVTIHQMLLMGMFLAFALLHLLHFLFYPQARANLIFAALSASFAMAVYFFFHSKNFNYSYYFITEPADLVWNARLLATAWVLMMLCAIRLTYLLIYPKLPRIFFAVCIAGFVMALGLDKQIG